jgi:hypothetical protein
MWVNLVLNLPFISHAHYKLQTVCRKYVSTTLPCVLRRYRSSIAGATHIAHTHTHTHMIRYCTYCVTRVCVPPHPSTSPPNDDDDDDVCYVHCACILCGTTNHDIYYVVHMLSIVRPPSPRLHPSTLSCTRVCRRVVVPICCAYLSITTHTK